MPTTATRPAAKPAAQVKAVTGQTLWSGQQVANDMRLDITGPGQVQLLYQPFGTTDWKRMELDPLVQFAIYKHAMDAGELPAGIAPRPNAGAAARPRPSAARAKVSVSRAQSAPAAAPAATAT